MKFLKENAHRNKKIESKLDEALGLSDDFNEEESETYKNLCNKYDNNTKLEMAYDLQDIAKYFDEVDAEALRKRYNITMPADNIIAFADNKYDDLVGYYGEDDDDDYDLDEPEEPSDEDLISCVNDFLYNEALYIDHPEIYKD